MKKQSKKKTLGTGLSAKCVVSPALKCKTAKNLNLKKRVSKIVQEPDSPILKEIFDREIFTSSLINSHPNRNLADRFITIDLMCPLDFSINKNREKVIKESCDLDSDFNYLLLNMYNGACLTTGKKKSRICGNLSNKETCKYLTKSNNRFKNFVRYLIEAFEFLHSLKVAHCDIKPLNLLCDEKGTVKVIDFGSSLFLDDMENGEKEFVGLCKNLNKVSSIKSRVFNKHEEFHNKVAAITPKYAPAEIVLLRSVLKNPNVMFSELYLDLILNNFNEDTTYFRKLIRKYLSNSKKVLNDIFCHKKQYIYSWDVYSLGHTIKDIYTFGKNKDKLGGNLNDLINKMTEIDYKKRITLKQALNHPYLK